jgi:hypothetical protein
MSQVVIATRSVNRVDEGLMEIVEEGTGAGGVWAIQT